MSSYSTALCLDLPAGTGPIERYRSLAAHLQTVEGADVAAWSTTAGNGFTRIVVFAGGATGTEYAVRDWLAEIGAGRAAIAEDNDEFGARWIVLVAAGPDVRTVHARYLFAVDPTDQAGIRAVIDGDFQGDDPRTEDVSGAAALARLAALYGVPPAEVQAAEAAAGTAYRTMGMMGGPFPWWEALGLPWPEDGAGTPL